MKNKTSGAKNTEFRLFIGLSNNGGIHEPKVAILCWDQIITKTFRHGKACNQFEEAAEAYSRQVSRGHNYRDLTCGFKAGAEWQKAKMMEGAVEGEVCGRVYDHINVRFADGVCKYLEPKNISHIPADVSKYNIGDKVKIIIVKEEEQ